jgi:Mn-containing catalase
MYHHVKKLMYTVRVDEPDPKFGNMLLEQFGGANGELAAAMQYSIQGLNTTLADLVRLRLRGVFHSAGIAWVEAVPKCRGWLV